MNRKVLIVEDDTDIRESLRYLFETENIEVAEAQDGDVALKYLARTKKMPSLILLDIMMPNKDAFQFREEQLRSAQYGHIPVIVMSADGNIEAKSIRLKADASIKKPLDVEAMLNLVSPYLSPVA